MFRETTVHKWDIVTIHSRLLYTIPRTLNTRYCLYWTSRDITSSFLPLNVKSFLVYRRLEKFYTAISPAIDLSNKFFNCKCFRDGWYRMVALRLNYLTRFRQVHGNYR